jgi:hypothetical protein
VYLVILKAMDMNITKPTIFFLRSYKYQAREAIVQKFQGEDFRFGDGFYSN